MGRTDETGALLEHLATFPNSVEKIPADDLSHLLAAIRTRTLRLYAVHEIILERLFRAVHSREDHSSDRLVDMAEAARMLGVTNRWLRRHSGHLPFTRKLSRRAVRYSVLGIQEWLQAARWKG